MELVIGDKAWSSWSLRPWLALKATGAMFDEVQVALRQGGDTRAAIAAHGAITVPILKDGEITVWDSLAICEYLAEKFPNAELWPVDAEARAVARSAAAEMHSGFRPLRMECPMALEIAPSAPVLSEDVQKDVARIVWLWRSMLARFGGPFLGGSWSIADAFYAPVATRFRTYGVDLKAFGDEDGTAAEYLVRVLSTPHFLEWEAAARAATGAYTGP
jgi:glutathione S-transferase